MEVNDRAVISVGGNSEGMVGVDKGRQSIKEMGWGGTGTPREHELYKVTG